MRILPVINFNGKSQEKLLYRVEIKINNSIDRVDEIGPIGRQQTRPGQPEHRE